MNPLLDKLLGILMAIMIIFSVPLMMFCVNKAMKFWDHNVSWNCEENRLDDEIKLLNMQKRIDRLKKEKERLIHELSQENK